MKAELRNTTIPYSFRARVEPVRPSKAEIERRFITHANMIGLRWDGLQDLTIYRDSQFEMEMRRADLPPADIPVARYAFNRAIDERVVREFPSHPAATISRKRLEDAKAVA